MLKTLLLMTLTTPLICLIHFKLNWNLINLDIIVIQMYNALNYRKKLEHKMENCMMDIHMVKLALLYLDNI